MLNYPFIGSTDLDRCGIPADDPRRRFVTLVNPLSEEQPGVRTTLLPGLLAAARRNVSRGADSVALFEVGAVAFARLGERRVSQRLPIDRRPTDEEIAQLVSTLPPQRHHMGGVLAGPIEHRGWWGPGRSATWSDALAIAVGIVRDLGLVVDVDSASYAPFHPGRCAVLAISEFGSDDETIIGYAGSYTEGLRGLGPPTEDVRVRV